MSWNKNVNDGGENRRSIRPDKRVKFYELSKSILHHQDVFVVYVGGRKGNKQVYCHALKLAFTRCLSGSMLKLEWPLACWHFVQI